MRKKFIVAVGLLSVAASLQSFTNRTKKAAYSFPPTMSAPIRDEYAKLCDKGQILYEENCAKCHNVRVKGKLVIPDFTQEQINGYEIRVGNAKHEGALTDEAITSEELGLISTFLLYKKKSGAQVADAFGGKLSED
jgi:mono/diheme cytochrome c family protein